jgi:hypothetical protein
MTNLITNFKSISQKFHEYPRDILILKMTVLVAMLFIKNTSIQHILILTIGSGMLLTSILIKNKLMWTLLALLVVYFDYTKWFVIDNHQYLLAYWVLTCTVAVYAQDTERILRINAKILIGLAFLFATMWKIIGLEYFDGHFLHYTMLIDSRMDVFAVFQGGLSPQTVSDNHQLLKTLLEYPELKSLPLTTTSSLLAFATLLCWLTILIEGLIALFFILPFAKIQAYRDVALLVFIFPTYIFFPVPGFGLTLCTMGISQVQSNHPKLFMGYLIAFVLMHLLQLPIEVWLIKYLGG